MLTYLAKKVNLLTWNSSALLCKIAELQMRIMWSEIGRTKVNMAAQQLVCLDDFEKYAFKSLPLNALDYYRSGANDQVTLKDNVEAFRR